VSASPNYTAATKDVAAGVILFTLAGLYYWQSLSIAQSTLSDEVGPEGLPVLLAGFLAVLALIIMVRGAVALLAARRVPEADARIAEEREPSEASLARAVGLLAIGVGYILVTPIVGYVFGIALLIAAVALYERAVPTFRLAIIAVVGGLFFWFVFVKLLGTDQPASWLF
jgi:hypothetical protein